ncbi:MAG: HEAT repeat domain-containing protein [Woeseiaceae bacterium]
MKAEVRPNHRPSFSLATIVVTGLISVVVAAATTMLVVSRITPSLSQDTSASELSDVVARLERLERRTAQNSQGNNLMPASESGTGARVTVDDLDTIEERIARLEQAAEARTVAERRQAEFQDNVRRMTEVYTHEVAFKVLADPAANDETKATAWRTIRYSAAQAWTDDIVMEAVRIGTTSTDPWIRADIWRQAHANHTHPLLLQPLLQALTGDSDFRVRSEAAETLDLYLGEIGVRDALQNAIEYDEHPDVRRQAQSSLKGPDGGF